VDEHWLAFRLGEGAAVFHQSSLRSEVHLPEDTNGVAASVKKKEPVHAVVKIHPNRNAFGVQRVEILRDCDLCFSLSSVELPDHLRVNDRFPKERVSDVQPDTRSLLNLLSYPK